MEDIKQAYAFIITSSVRKKVLLSLKKKPLRQAEIADMIKQKQPNISKVLFDLEKHKLVECLTPEKKAWKVYEITDFGREVLKKL
ncbi:MAG: MarR family transcriptional regulator [archaeon GW2011_AR11]|nr:MAG: MarR family transcriptional regulator [archaeon GW2011_AR11]